MLGNRELTISDYLVMVRRRWLVVLLPLLLCPVITYGVALLLHEQYTSETLVLVEGQKVPDAYVRSVVTDDLNQRLVTMQEQILSRTRLQPLIEKFGLYKEDVGRVPMEDLVGRLRKSIEVKTARTMEGARTAGLPGFTISFTADSPRLAQQVCTQITSMFIEENLHIRETRSQGTTDFLAKQLEESKQKLDEQDSKLAALKQRYIGQLPGQEQVNMNLLLGANTQLDAVTQQLTRAQQDKVYVQSLLTQAVAAWQSSQEANSPDTLEKQLATLQAEFIKLEARYTPDHPDVIKAKNDIALLKRKIAEANAKTKDKPPVEAETTKLVEPVQIQSLRNQIHLTDQTIQEKTREQDRLEAQVRTYQARVQLSPVVEEQFKQASRDYETALKFYNELLTKRNESEMATRLERGQQGEQFRVMDPANLPEKPSFPNRPLFAGGGIGAGLLIAVGLVALMEAGDKSLRNERDVEFYLKLPTLALLPSVEGGNGRRSSIWKRKKREALAVEHSS
jgi:polysaccharide chain length determinant protein (PEP-CTERM system associated)